MFYNNIAKNDIQTKWLKYTAKWESKRVGKIFSKKLKKTLALFLNMLYTPYCCDGDNTANQ